MATRLIVPPDAYVVANEATASIDDDASMGAGDNVHLVDDGGYPNAEASQVGAEALASLD